MAFIPFLGYEASAGSGKTFNLVVRYLSLLFMGTEPEKILALTFTNKAASEMSERIIATMQDLENRGELDVIAATLERPKEELLAKKSELMGLLLNSELKIMTIDKFFAQVLRKFSLYEGLQPNFAITAQAREIDIIKQMLSRTEVAGEQKRLIHLALMTQKRLADLFELLGGLYLKQKEFGKLSFTEENFAVLENVVMQHALNIRQMVLKSGSASQTAINGMSFDTIEELLAKSWIGKESLNYRTFSKCFVPAMDEELQLLYEAVTRYFKAKESSFFASLFALLDLYSTSRMNVAKNGGELSFDDVTVVLYKLLKEETIHSDFLYFRLDARIDHILLDEFQDTSVVQFDILSPLVDEITSGLGVGDFKSFFYVGDVKQSIYRFRGGNKALFAEVKDRYEVDMQRLNTNYRSQFQVVDFVNRTFDKKIENYFPQEVAAGQDGGYVEVIENEEIIDEVATVVSELLQDGVQANDIAVLTWQNKDGLLVEEAVKKLGVEVVTETSARLINHPQVAGIIELLKFYYFGEPLYFENFKALVGLADVMVIDFDIKTLTLKELLHAIVKRYGIFNGDQNIIRFIDLISNYKDIDQLVFEIERESESLTKLDQIGVRVLTVHKSKGLEFRHVITIDRLGKKNADRSSIIYHYDGTHLKNIFLRQKNREHFDEAYKAAKEYNARMAKEDELNAMYVAFTRAQERLYVIKKPKGSIFEPLDLELASYGAKQKAKVVPMAVEKRSDFSYTPVTLGVQEVAKSASEDEGKDHEAIEYGLALHFGLEMLSAFTKEALDIAMTAVKNRFRLPQYKLDSIRDRVSMLLDDGEFGELVDGEVSKEQPLAIDGKLYYIDLLIEKADHYVVIDYKSSQEGYVHHERQVRNYLYGVNKITGKMVKGYLAYLLEDGIKIKAL